MTVGLNKQPRVGSNSISKSIAQEYKIPTHCRTRAGGKPAAFANDIEIPPARERQRVGFLDLECL